MGRITPRNDKNLATHMKTLDIQLLSKSRYTVMTNDYVSSKGVLQINIGPPVKRMVLC